MSARPLVLALALAFVLGATWFALRGMRRTLPATESVTVESAAGAPSEPKPVSLEDATPSAERKAMPGAPGPGKRKGSARASSSEPSGPLALLRVEVVSLETGAPIPGVHLEVSGARRSATSDATGRAEFRVKTGRVQWLTARAWEAQAGSRLVGVEPLTPDEERTIRVALPTAFDSSWFAQVVDGETGLPILGAEVDAYFLAPDEPQPDPGDPLLFKAFVTPNAFVHVPDSLDNRPRLARGTTDADGRVALNLPSWGIDVVRVESEGHFSRFVEAEGKRSPEAPFTVELLRTAALAVHVLETDGAPAVEIDVWLHVEGFDLERDGFGSGLIVPERSWAGSTDWAGSCALSGLPARVPMEVELRRGERVLLRPAKRDSEPGLKLEPGERRSIEWRLESGCTLAGVVLDAEGQAIPALPLVLAEYRAGSARGDGNGRWEPIENHEMVDRQFAALTTDASGRFFVAGVPAGDFALAPDDSVEDLPRVGLFFRITPDERSKELELRFERGLTIRGKVLDPEGIPVAGCWIRATRFERFVPGLSVRFDSKRDGSFALGPLVSGWYQVEVTKAPNGLLAPPERVQVHSGQQDLVLKMRWGGLLRGRMVDQAGELVSAHVVLIREDGITSEDGGSAFDFTGLLPGRYALVGTTEDGKVGVLQDLVVEPRSKLDDIVLRVQRGCEVLLRLLGDGQGRHYEVSWSGTRVAKGWLDPGEEARVFVPPGPIVVAWKDYGSWLEHEERRTVVSPDEQVVIEYESDD